MSKTGSPRCFCPPFLGVTPPTNFVPYLSACSEWKVPCEPVNPWQITLVFLSTKIDIYFIALTIFFAASFKSDADNILRPDSSKILFPSL